MLAGIFFSLVRNSEELIDGRTTEVQPGWVSSTRKDNNKRGFKYFITTPFKIWNYMEIVSLILL